MSNIDLPKSTAKANSVVIVPYMPKGGVGKTTIAAHLGYALAKKGKTLVIDADPQANLTSHFMRNEEFAETDRSLIDFFNKRFSFSECVVDARPVTDKFQLYIVGLSVDNDLKEYIQSKFPNNPSVLKQLVGQAKKDGFEFIIFDPPGDFGHYTKSIISYCTHLLPIIEPESFGYDAIFTLMDGLKEIKEGFDVEFNNNIIVINKFNHKNATHNKFKNIMDESPFQPIFVIPDTNSIPFACSQSKLLQEEKPKHPAVSVIDSIVDHIYKTTI